MRENLKEILVSLGGILFVGFVIYFFISGINFMVRELDLYRKTGDCQIGRAHV